MTVNMTERNSRVKLGVGQQPPVREGVSEGGSEGVSE